MSAAEEEWEGLWGFCSPNRVVGPGGARTKIEGEKKNANIREGPQKSNSL